MFRGMRFLCAIGYAPEDVADGIYSSPRILAALADGDFLGAQDLADLRMVDALRTVEGSGITEERLWILTEEGLALGEISWAIRNIHGFQHSVQSLSLDAVKTHARSTYEFFREDRSTRRTTRTSRWGIGGKPIDRGAVPESWSEHYSNVLKNAKRLRSEAL